MTNYNKKQFKKWRVVKLYFYLLYFILTISVVIIFKIDWLATFLLILSGVLIVIAEFASERESYFKKGEDGELHVDKILQSIPDIYLYRDVLLGENEPWNIDFVIISKAGVFILEVKSYDGRITANNDMWYQSFNNKRRSISSFSKQARGNAFKLREYLSNRNSDISLPYFTPVVVLTKSFEKSDIKNDVNNTQVISPEEISVLVSNGTKITSEQANFLVNEMNKLDGKI